MSYCCGEVLDLINKCLGSNPKLRIIPLSTFERIPRSGEISEYPCVPLWGGGPIWRRKGRWGVDPGISWFERRRK